MTITVNVGPETGKIPTNLVGEEKDKVQQELEDAGFTNVDLKEAEDEDPDTEADEVISVSPKEGATAAKSAKITVTYATGKSPVPNFIGSSEQRARDDAKAAGFDSVQVVSEPSNERPVGTVMRQNPEAGKVVDRTERHPVGHRRGGPGTHADARRLPRRRRRRPPRPAPRRAS